MGWDAWVTLAVLLVTIAALAREILPPSGTILGAVIALLAAGVITPAQAFAGFSNPAPITVAALYVLARAVDKTGAIQPIVTKTLGKGDSIWRSLARLAFPTAGASAFLNNTPIVAMLVPQVADWADRRGFSPSHFLLPLSYAAIFGGMVTLMGTSTNLVVSGLLENAGEPALGMFEITKLGLPIALVGILLLVLLAPLLLPERRPARGDLGVNVREFVVNLDVVDEGPLDGSSVEGGGLRHLQGVYLVEVDRSGELIAPVPPDTVLHGGDRLTFVGRAELIRDLQNTRGLVPEVQEHLGGLDTSRHTFFEAVVGAASPLVGRTLKEVEFRGRYQAAVVAIHRSGGRVKAKLGEVRLRVGDTLMLLAGHDFRQRWRDRSDFLLVSRLGGTPPIATRKAGLVGLIAVSIILGAGFGLLPILHLSLLGAMGLVLLGVLTPGEARDAVDLDVILVIAGAFGLGAAIQVSGLAGSISGLVIQMFGGLGAIGALLGILLTTLALTTIISNNTAAVLMFPIAWSTAASLGIDQRVFVIVLAIGASASFLTPIAYQTNLMVYGPGGYRFFDYARLGLPVTIAVIAGILILVPALGLL